MVGLEGFMTDSLVLQAASINLKKEGNVRFCRWTRYSLAIPYKQTSTNFSLSTASLQSKAFSRNLFTLGSRS